MSKLMYKKRVMVPAIALTVIAGGLLASSWKSKALASTQVVHESEGIVQKLARRFNLNEQEVKQVFDDVRLERMADHHAILEERLAKAVENGQLSEVQKEAILEKFQELQNKHYEQMKDYQNKSAKVRRSERKKEKEELRAWAEEHGINFHFFRHGLGTAKVSY